jgi:hypothetical protein
MKERTLLKSSCMLALLLAAGPLHSIARQAGPERKAGPGVKAAKEDFYLRTFSWSAADKKSKRVVFSLAKSLVRSELNQFGVPRGMESSLLLQKKGFTRVGISKNVEIYAVDYRDVLLRSLDYFAGLTRTLAQAIESPRPENDLREFLVFVQSITYKLPPFYYGNRFINSFFPPLICLYEQYGDCDSKSILLAAFLACQDKNEKTALLFINYQGLEHSVLAVKRTPGLGMSAVFIKGKGYYIPLEASSTGWAPGFVNQRIWNAIKAGGFLFIELT